MTTWPAAFCIVCGLRFSVTRDQKARRSAAHKHWLSLLELNCSFVLALATLILSKTFAMQLFSAVLGKGFGAGEAQPTKMNDANAKTQQKNLFIFIFLTWMNFYVVCANQGLLSKPLTSKALIWSSRLRGRQMSLKSLSMQCLEKQKTSNVIPSP